jgi:protein SCO1/2
MRASCEASSLSTSRSSRSNRVRALLTEPTPRQEHRKRGAGTWLLVGILAAGVAASSPGLAAQRAHAFHGIASASSTRAADFALTGPAGKRVRLSDFQGKTVLLYFGYTSCPGICPTTLADVSQALKTLGPARAANVQFIMVTVDPERDTPDKLATYLTYFNRSFLGVTGTAEEIATVAARYGIYYRRSEGTPETGYLIDHTSMVIAIDGKGYVRVLFPHGTPVPDMAGDLAYLVPR